MCKNPIRKVVRIITGSKSSKKITPKAAKPTKDKDKDKSEQPHILYTGRNDTILTKRNKGRLLR